jgi:hypothetical protein
MHIQPLVNVGNKRAIILDESLLQAAGISEDTIFSIVIHPNGGLTIQSIEPTHCNIKKAAFKKAVKENHAVLKRLADT